MSVRVPRAPRPADAPELFHRMGEVRAKARSLERASRGHGPFSFGPAICVLAGTGLLFLTAALLIELAPQSPVAQLLIAICVGLPLGG